MKITSFSEKNKDKISKENTNKFVLMCNKKFLAFYSTKDDAMTAGEISI